MENYKFTQNKKCEFFPCHKTSQRDNFNCLFCYCPLYLTGKECGGNFSYTKNGIKDCSNCLIPHKRENYEYINTKLMEYTKMKQKQELKNIKLIVTDLDHTILKDEFSLEECYIKTFEDLRKQGYMLAFATARGFYQAYNYAYRLKPDYIICDNGASIVQYDYEKEEKHILKEVLIDEEIKKDIFSSLKDDTTLIYLIESGEKIYITMNEYNPEFVKQNVDFFSSIEKRVKNFKLCKVKTIRDIPTNIPLTRVCTFDFVSDKKVHQTLRNIAKNHPKLKYTNSFTTTFEFGLSDKGSAVRYLTEYLHLNKENVLSFGDSTTDISMLEASGIGVCVENGKDELKQIATYIAPSVFDNGVDKFIRKNLLNEK